MIFFLAITLLIGGFCLAAIPVLIPQELGIPMFLNFILIIFGLVLALVGQIMLYGRAKKTSAIHLINPPRYGEHLWLYAHRDGSLMFTPGVRNVESQLYSPELDAQIQEFKSYRMYDHSLRIVPEGIGHAVDLGMILYVQLMKNKYGYESIREAREEANRIEKLNPMKGGNDVITAEEKVITQEIIKNVIKYLEAKDGETC